MPARRKSARKTAARKTARKTTARKTTARNKTARKTPARKKPARKVTGSAGAKRPAKRRAAKPSDAGRVTVENVNVPGYKTTVDAEKYQAMRAALLKVLPKKGQGLTQTEMGEAVRPHLPEALFPGGAKAMWWVKCVQLDLEAKGEVQRDVDCKPLRWSRVAG